MTLIGRSLNLWLGIMTDNLSNELDNARFRSQAKPLSPVRGTTHTAHLCRARCIDTSGDGLGDIISDVS